MLHHQKGVSTQKKHYGWHLDDGLSDVENLSSILLITYTYVTILSYTPHKMFTNDEMYSVTCKHSQRTYTQ